MSHPSTPTTLYRLFSQGGDLLYVGITGDPGRRLGQHADEKPWWPAVSTIRLEHFADRASAAEAERRAIRTELPAHNLRDVPSGPRWVELWPGTAEQFPDHCERCDKADRIDWADRESWVHHPERALVEGEWLTGLYRCRECGWTWACGFTWRTAA